MDTPFLPPRYRLIRTLGEGGVGRVILAEDSERDHLRVAVKLLAPADPATEDDWARRLVEEARVLARLDHPHIVKLLDVGHLDTGRPFLVFELVEGTDLARVLEERAPLAPEEALRFVSPIVDALGHAHALGVVHRDVKPANVLVRAADGQPLLADFGCARSADRTIKTQAGMVLGTPGYVAPEVLVGQEPVPQSDLYAVGCVLFEALVGKAPFTAPSPAELLIAHLREPAPPTGLARPLDRVIQRLLSKKPEERPATARELAEALDAAQVELLRGTGRGGHTRVVTGGERPTRPVSRAGMTMVAKSERLMRREERQRTLTRVVAGVLVAGAALGLGAWMRVRAQRATPVRPVITVDTRGTLRAVWSSVRPTRCVLSARVPGGAGGGAREQVESESLAAHAMVLERLQPHTGYQVEIRTVEGDPLWSTHLELPSLDEVQVRGPAPDRTQVEVALRGRVEQVELLRGDERPLPPVLRNETRAVFELPVARSLLEGHVEVRVTDARGVRASLPVMSGAEAVKRLLAELTRERLESAFRSLTEPPYWNRHAHPVYPNLGEKATRTIADRRAEAHQALHEEPGGFGRRVKARLRETPGGPALLELVPTLPRFFESATVEPALKRALYERLLAVEWLDRLCIAQFEAPALQVASWYAPIVRFEHALPAQESAFPGSCHVMERCRGFVDESGIDQSAVDIWTVHSGWPSFCMGKVPSLNGLAPFAQPVEALATMYPQAKGAGLFRRSGKAELRARVALLEPTHAFEVLFHTGKPEDGFRVTLGQPGSDDWRQAMDELLPDGQFIMPIGRGPALWGEVTARFDASLLPPGELYVSVRYARVPGQAPLRLTHLPRFAVLSSLRMRITD